jgi:hypothetical protein
MNRQEPTMPIHSATATPDVHEALADLLALLLAPAGRPPSELVERLAALDAFERLELEPRHFARRLDEAMQEANATLCNRSWLQDSDRARIEQLMAPITDPALRAGLCAIASAVLGEDDTVSHSRCQVLDHVVSGWHVELPHHAPRAW